MIKHEFYKLFHAKAFWICLPIMLGFYTAMQLLNAIILVINPTNEFDEPKGVDGLDVLLSSSQMWSVVVAVMIANIIVNDYPNGIMRNMILAGKQRWQIYLVKLFMCAVVSLVFFFTTLLSATCVNTAFFGFGHMSVSLYLTGFFLAVLLTVAMGSLFMLIAYATRNAGVVIASSVFLYLLCAGLTMAEGLEIFGIRLDCFYVGYLFGDIGNLLMVDVVLRVAAWQIAMIGVLTLAICVGLGYWLFRRREIK